MNKVTGRIIAILSLVLATSLLTGSVAHAALVNRAVLKNFFEKGDVPTAQQFSNFIDSYIHQTDDGFTLVGIGTDPSSGDLRALHLVQNDVVDQSLTYADPSTQPPVAPDWAALSGFLPLEYQDTGGQAHFGFLQMSMDAQTDPPAADGPAIHVDYWAWETSANTAVTLAPVPEPTSLSVIFLSSAILLRRWRKFPGAFPQLRI